MSKFKVLLIGLFVALSLNFVSYLISIESYCENSTHFIFQFIYKVYTIQPPKCEIEQAEKYLPQFNSSSPIETYTEFKDKVMKEYVTKIPPFLIEVIEKSPRNSIKDSTNIRYERGNAIMTARNTVEETLHSGRGDCDDFSTALYSIFKLQGYDAGIILLKLKNTINNSRIHHEVTVVKYNDNYYIFDAVNDITIVGKTFNEALSRYEQALIYYRIEYYWVFHNSIIPKKSF